MKRKRKLQRDDSALSEDETTKLKKQNRVDKLSPAVRTIIDQQHGTDELTSDEETAATKPKYKKKLSSRQRTKAGSPIVDEDRNDESDNADTSQSSLIDDVLGRLMASESAQNLPKDCDTEEDEVIVKLKNELAGRPFSDIQKLKDKIGTKAYNVMFGSSATGPHGKKVFKRANKHRPMEVSSKVKVPYLRKVVPVAKKGSRDPRFDDLSGEYNERLFKTAYSFLDDVREHEKQKILKEIKKTKDDERKAELKGLLRIMNNREKAKKKDEDLQRISAQQKKNEVKLVQHGKQPFYLKQSDKKKLVLAEKYRELKKSGKVESYLSKKRKKNASRDRKRLPVAGTHNELNN